MNKLFYSLLFGILFSLVYFAFFSKILYCTVGIINTYYLDAIILGLILLIILNKTLWNLKYTHLVIAILGMILFIFMFPLLFDAFFEEQLRNLYARGYENIFDIVLRCCKK